MISATQRSSRVQKRLPEKSFRFLIPIWFHFQNPPKVFGSALLVNSFPCLKPVRSRIAVVPRSHFAARCPSQPRASRSVRRFSSRKHPVISRFQPVISGVGGIGSAVRGRCPGTYGSSSLLIGLALRHDLLLWNLLVADLSDYSLRAHYCVAGLSDAAHADHSGCAVPCGFLQPAFAHRSTLRPCGYLRRSVDLDLDRMAALCRNRPTMERIRLLAGVPSNADSVRSLGWSLRRFLLVLANTAVAYALLRRSFIPACWPCNHHCHRCLIRTLRVRVSFVSNQSWRMKHVCRGPAECSMDLNGDPQQMDALLERHLALSNKALTEAGQIEQAHAWSSGRSRR